MKQGHHQGYEDSLSFPLGPNGISFSAYHSSLKWNDFLISAVIVHGQTFSAFHYTMAILNNNNDPINILSLHVF